MVPAAGSTWPWLGHAMDGDRAMPKQAPMAGVLGWLMPMHLMLDCQGKVHSHGPTLGRVFDGQPLEGMNFFELFEVKSPVALHGPDDFAAIAGQKLRLNARTGVAGLRLRGLLLPLPTHSRQGPDSTMGWIVNLSFGIDLLRAVALLQLTDADFAPTELAMELLYLAEANAAVTGELRALTLRLEGARRQAREEAETDTLTGLRNRRACDSMLARLCREGAPFGLLHMDLDYFKAVNDTLGHAAGDHVLVHVAGVMRSTSRADDCQARVGGDEFVMLLPGITDPGTLRLIAERIIDQLRQPILWQETACRISASVGFVAVEEGQMPDPAQVLADADHALYAAKNAGRGRAMQADSRGTKGTRGNLAAAG